MLLRSERRRRRQRRRRSAELNIWSNRRQKKNHSTRATRFTRERAESRENTYYTRHTFGLVCWCLLALLSLGEGWRGSWTHLSAYMVFFFCFNYVGFSAEWDFFFSVVLSRLSPEMCKRPIFVYGLGIFLCGVCIMVICSRSIFAFFCCSAWGAFYMNITRDHQTTTKLSAARALRARRFLGPIRTTVDGDGAQRKQRKQRKTQESQRTRDRRERSITPCAHHRTSHTHTHHTKEMCSNVWWRW